MTVVAFTGPTLLTAAQELFVDQVVVQTKADEFLSGCAHGVDTVAALAADGSGRTVALAVPAAPHNAELVGKGKTHGWRVVYVPGAATASAAYMARNDVLANECDVLLAFPETGAEELRSGTWATVRRARKRGKEIRVLPLNGDPIWVER